MLARLLQTVVAVLVLAILAWLAWWGSRGAWLVAGAGAVLLLGGHAAVLALEFGLLAAINRGDPAPQATAGQLLRAWWGEVRAASSVFLWRQPFRSRRWSDHLPPGAQGRRGLLLVHGYVCNRGLWNRWLQRLHAMDTPVVAVNLEPVFGEIDAYATVLEAAARRLEAATGLPPVVVAHSMGGLAVRFWLAQTGGVDRVHHVVTIGTPHRGTWLARFALTRNAVQMRLGSPWHGSLVGREVAAAMARYTCFYGHCDNIVFPASTATLPGADNRHLEAVAHVHMADHPAVFAEALHRLQAPLAPQAGPTELA